MLVEYGTVVLVFTRAIPGKWQTNRHMATLSEFRIYRPQPTSAMRAATAENQDFVECILWAVIGVSALQPTPQPDPTFWTLCAGLGGVQPTLHDQTLRLMPKGWAPRGRAFGLQLE